MALISLKNCQESFSENISLLNQTKKRTLSYSTFSTKLVKNLIPQKLTLVTSTSTERPRIYLQDLILDYQRNKFYVIVFLLLICCTPFGLLIWLTKKFGIICLRFACEKMCRKKSQNSLRDLINKNQSDSMLSGECGCIIRFHKENNRQLKQAIKQNTIIRVGLLDENQVQKIEYCKLKRISISSASIETRQSIKYSTLQRFKSAACILIAFNNRSDSNKMNRAACINRIESDDEDLDEYSEYAQKSLSNLNSSLAKLDKS